MPTLRRWFEAEYERLQAEDKGTLALAFDAFCDLYFDGHPVEALTALPDVRALAHALGEPVWEVIADYYDASAHINWLGDLACGRDLAVRAAVQVAHLNAPIPALYARETLLAAWLDTDGPGYSADVLAAVEEIPRHAVTPDVAARFDLVRANALAACGEGDHAARTALAALPALRWPPAYQYSLKGSTLLWTARPDDAADAFRAAIEKFEGAGQHVERTGAVMGLGEALLALGELDDALATLDAAHEETQRSINRAHVAQARGLLARVLLAMESPRDAADWLDVALDAFDGLGWDRAEAETAVLRLYALRQAGRARGATWEAALWEAERAIGRLRDGGRGSDLADELDAFSNGRAA
jgi:tetratricopeptide (TPR) repeat protein